MVSLATSCSTDVDDVWEQNSNQYWQGNFRERKEGKQIKWKSTQVNTVICFTEVRFQRT
jgi:Leu/Phe-tRNA-protein transferase